MVDLPRKLRPLPLPEIRALLRDGKLDEAERAVRERIETEGSQPRPWMLLGEVLLARGDDVAAFRAFRTAMRHGDDGGRALGLILGILNMRWRRVAARRVAEALAPYAGKFHVVDNQLGQEALARGDIAALDAVLARPPTERPLARLTAVRETIRAEAAAGEQPGLRHIAIGGVNYVGSTALALILGSAPGVATAGESHWLLFTDQSDPEYGTRRCRICGDACEAYSHAFKDAMMADRTHWFARLAARVGTDVLITSDKYFNMYRDRDPFLRFDAVVIYKTPEVQMASFLKARMAKGEYPSALDLLPHLAKELNGWAANYLALLYGLPGRKVVVLDWERFVENPGPHLTRLGALLELPLDPDLPNRIRRQHVMGGNNLLDVPAIFDAGRIALRKSNAPPLPAEILEKIHAHKRANYVWAILERRYREAFS